MPVPFLISKMKAKPLSFIPESCFAGGTTNGLGFGSLCAGLPVPTWELSAGFLEPSWSLQRRKTNNPSCRMVHRKASGHPGVDLHLGLSHLPWKPTSSKDTHLLATGFSRDLHPSGLSDLLSATFVLPEEKNTARQIKINKNKKHPIKSNKPDLSLRRILGDKPCTGAGTMMLLQQTSTSSTSLT